MANEAKVKKDDMVTVYSTGTTKFAARGAALTVHRIAADTLVKQKKAVVKASDLDKK